MQVKFKKIGPGAKPPVRVTEGSAGLDLFAARKKTVPTNKTALIDTDWAVAIPKGHVGLIKINSGNATRYSITENAGVIDSDYRGHLKVAISNPSSDPFKVEKGEKIAQLIVMPCLMTDPLFVEDLDKTERGEKGFGEASRT